MHQIASVKNPADGKVTIYIDDPNHPAPLNAPYGFCDILGIDQRKWLKNEIKNSNADLLIIVSGSVLINDPARPVDFNVRWEKDLHIPTYQPRSHQVPHSHLPPVPDVRRALRNGLRVQPYSMLLRSYL